MIEGHNNLPREIEQALAGISDAEDTRRNLQIEAVAHIRMQQAIDAQAAAGALEDPADWDIIRRLHCAFYDGAAEPMLTIGEGDRGFRMKPGAGYVGRPPCSVIVHPCRDVHGLFRATFRL